MLRSGMRFAIHTLGCRVNTYESDAIAGALKAYGFTECAFSEAADVYIINTCTVTNVADKKSRQMLHRAKKQNPKALVVAAGCYVDAALQNPEMQALLKDASVDLLLPNRDKGRAAELILSELGKRAEGAGTAEIQDRNRKDQEEVGSCGLPGRPIGDREGAGKEEGTGENRNSQKKTGETYGLFVTELDGHTRAFVKVQDGCNQFCSYCIIPYVRGRIRSRRIQDCVREIKGLAEKGVKEVVLTGIHLSSYGKDWEKQDALGIAEHAEPGAVQAEGAERDPNRATGTDQTEPRPEGAKAETSARRMSDDIETGEGAPLLTLIRAVAELEGIERIRMGSLEPRLMSEAFVRALSEIPKVCPHFHLSLQSGSRETLKRMNRHYTPEQYRESCERLRRYFDDPAITTDVIVGFPGETEEAFLESLSFVREMGFYELHVFPYSRRAGTLADRMEGQVPEAVKEARGREMLKLGEELSKAYRRRFLGKRVSMLCEEAIEAGGKQLATGYSREYVRCAMECSAFHPGEILSGVVSEICKEKPVYECLFLR